MKPRAACTLVVALAMAGCAHAPPAREGEEVSLSGYLGTEYKRPFLFTLPAEARKPNSLGFADYYDGCFDLTGNAAMHDRFAELDGDWVKVRALKVTFPGETSGAYMDEKEGLVFWHLRKRFRGVRVNNPQCGDRRQTYWVVDMEPADAPPR